MKNSKFIKMICLMISLVMIFSMSAFAVDEADTFTEFRVTEHEHGFLDNHVRDPIAAGDIDAILGGESFSVEAAASCPRGCGGTLRNVCSGEYSTTYYEEKCSVGSHPSNCKTIQSKCYTAQECTNCAYYSSGTSTHIEAYYHSQRPEVYDNHYCGYPKRSNQSPANSFSVEEYVDDGHIRDPIAAGDIENIVSE